MPAADAAIVSGSVDVKEDVGKAMLSSAVETIFS